MPGANRARIRHPWWTAAAVGFVAIVGFVLVWFQPQKLVIDEKVNEAAPSTATSETALAPVMPQSTGPAQPVQPTQFRGIDHETTGSVLVLPGTVRFEDLDTSNGPDLHVYLSTTPHDGPRDAFDDDYVELGRLKGNKGDQNYDVPPGTDVARYRSVVIWCKRFSVPFGAAPLSQPGQLA